LRLSLSRCAIPRSRTGGQEVRIFWFALTAYGGEAYELLSHLNTLEPNSLAANLVIAGWLLAPYLVWLCTQCQRTREM